MSVMLAEHESGLVYATEIALWTTPTLLAFTLACRFPKGTRIAWVILGTACLAIVLDKALDLLSVAHKTGQQLVKAVDPETRMRDGNLVYRFLLLGGLFVASSLGLVFCLRRDRDRSRGKVLAFVGLLLVLAYIAARMIPGLKERLLPPTGWIVEAVSYALILLGLIYGWRHPPEDRPTADSRDP
jgi:hypothetical protein